MIRGLILASLLCAPLAAAQAQVNNDGSIPTETQERLRAGTGTNFPWDLLGLFGLLGLLGLREEGHHEDSYHPAPVE